MEQLSETTKDRRLKLLISSNAVWTASGYATETGYLLKRLKADGWNIAMNAWTGHSGHPIDYEGIPTYGVVADQFGADGDYFHSKHFGAHAIIMFSDIWTKNPQFLQQIMQEGRKVIPWVPIDQEPVPQNTLNNLRFAHRIITLSKFGQQALQRAGFTSTFITEGTDINVFKPYDKKECRKMFQMPEDLFVCGMVGANKENPPRKGWQEAIEAFCLFHAAHPKSLFFFQTNQNSPGGFPIRPFSEHKGLVWGKDILALDDYLATFHFGSEQMAKLLSMFDVLMHVSLSEGFGLIIVESQACGTPVIVNDAQSQPELIAEGVTGEIVRGGKKFFTNAGGYYVIPDPMNIYQKLEKIYRADRSKMGKDARAHVEKNFNIDTIFQDKWIPFLETLQLEILGKPKVEIPPLK